MFFFSRIQVNNMHKKRSTSRILQTIITDITIQKVCLLFPIQFPVTSDSTSVFSYNYIIYIVAIANIRQLLTIITDNY